MTLRSRPTRSRPLFRLMVLLACWAGASPMAFAEGSPVPGATRLAPAQPATLAADGTLQLADGRRARLAGIELPSLRPGDRAPALTSLVERSREGLSTMLAAGPLTLWTSEDAGLDRWGRLPVFATTSDGRWVQGELLRLGLARVLATAEDDAAIPALLAAEEPARTTRIGLWTEARYALRGPLDGPRLLDSVQVVEGRVTSINVTRNAIYVNLGEDRRRALGIRIARRLAGDFAEDPAGWKGRLLRVRGWVGKSIGPLIDIGHPGQIELLTKAGLPASGMADAK